LRAGGETISRRVLTAAVPRLVAALRLSDQYDYQLDGTGTLRPVQVVLGTAYELNTLCPVILELRAEGIVPAPQVDPTFRVIAAVAADQKTVGLFDVAPGESRHTLPAHDGGVLSVGFSADGSRLATAGREGRIHVADTRAGKVAARTPAFDP